MASTDSSPQRELLLRQFISSHLLQGLDPSDMDLALVHRSYSFEQGMIHDNERLEFLGDSILAAITSEMLFEKFPEANEGTLSRQRSQYVSRTMLGRRAAEMGLGDLMLLGRGERDTGGAARLSILGSALEALVAIIYLKLGYSAARAFVCRQILDALIDETQSTAAALGDYKSALQEWAQQRFKRVPVYRRLGEAGPDHDKVFQVAVELDGQELAQGSGPRIKSAENEAARLALEKVTLEEK